MKTISLSPSKLGLLKDCPRCFWLANNKKIAQPRGIFPSLPGGVDRVMKNYTDQFRGGMIPELCKDLTGTLWGSVADINKLRRWQSGLKTSVLVGDTSVDMIGALDDLIQEADGSYSVFDTKTKGDVPKDDGSQYYQAQLDIYGLMLRDNGMQPSGKAYLCYFYPVEATGTGLAFKHALYTLTASPERAIDLITKAVGVLNGDVPASGAKCEYCSHHHELSLAGF